MTAVPKNENTMRLNAKRFRNQNLETYESCIIIYEKSFRSLSNTQLTMLFRSTLAIFLLAIPSVLSERESKLPKSGGQSRRRVKVGKGEAEVEPCCEVSEPTVFQHSYLLESSETFVSFGASEVPTFFVDRKLETDSAFVPGIVGTVFVDRGLIIGIDGQTDMGLPSDYDYTITCTVLEGDFVSEAPLRQRERKMQAGSSFEFSKVSCDIDLCLGAIMCLHLRVGGPLDGSLFVSGSSARPPDWYEEFRASVISGFLGWRGSIGEAVLKQVDNGKYQVDVGVIINDYGDLVDTTTVWE